MSGEGGSLALEIYVDDGVVLGLGIFVNLHKLFCDKTVMSGCVDASLHKVLVRYPNPVLVVDTVDEWLSKWSVVEERLEWEIIFSSFDGCKSTLNDWKNPSSSVDDRYHTCIAQYYKRTSLLQNLSYVEVSFFDFDTICMKSDTNQTPCWSML